MKLLSLFGLDRRLRRLRIAAGEGALAAEDRAQLVRLAWDDEKHRLKRMLALALLVLGLTTVAVALLSVAVVVHFWETPQRVAAAWAVALVWLALWLGAALGLVASLRGSANGFAVARREFEHDWQWLRRRIGDGAVRTPRQPRATNSAEVLARIARQRERIAMLQEGAVAAAGAAQGAAKAPPPDDETASEAALRLAREHPVATAALAAGAVVVLGPRRIVRWAAWLVPVLWRMR